MRVLFLTDRLSTRGGADLHLLQVMGWAVGRGHRVTVGCGRVAPGAKLPPGVSVRRIRGLAAPLASETRLAGLETLLEDADVVHLQNVMNPVAIERAVATGRALATVQDHRVFCPATGKTLPDGDRCSVPMSPEPCRRCLADPAYLARTLDVTAARREALRGARLVVLSRYMAEELAAVGLPGAEVVPPWVATGPERSAPGTAVLLGGRLVPHKGVVEGWRAWCAAGRALPLRVAGEGPLADRLRGAERLGWLPPRELRTELRRARMLLFPAVWQEPFGILGVEALAEGTPVVVADVGGTRDWSDAGCIRVPPGDVDAMAAAIGHLAGSPELSRTLGESGRRMVAGRYPRELHAPRLAALYRDVAGAAG